MAICAAGLAILGFTAWLGRERIREAWDFHIVESGSPERSARVLARRLELDPRRAAPYVALEILDGEKLAWVEALVEEIDLRSSGAMAHSASRQVAKGGPLGIASDRMVPFETVDDRTRRLLAAPDLGPAADNGDLDGSPEQRRYEVALIRGLEDSSHAIRLQTLALLVRVRSPGSVATQWTVLQALKQERVSQAWDRAISSIAASFDGSAILRDLEDESRPWRQIRHRDYLLEWSLRAAGVTGLRSALPRLRELSASADLNVAIAAERSLEDFTGPEADAALLHCLLAWRYRSFIRAGWALLARDPARMLEALEPAEPPESAREWRNLFLMQARMRLRENASK